MLKKLKIKLLNTTYYRDPISILSEYWLENQSGIRIGSLINATKICISDKGLKYHVIALKFLSIADF